MNKLLLISLCLICLCGCTTNTAITPTTATTTATATQTPAPTPTQTSTPTATTKAPTQTTTQPSQQYNPVSSRYEMLSPDVAAPPDPSLFTTATNKLTVNAEKNIGKLSHDLWANIKWALTYQSTIDEENQPFWELVRQTRAFNSIHFTSYFADGIARSNLPSIKQLLSEGQLPYIGGRPNYLPYRYNPCGVYSEDKQGNPIYDWGRLDSVLDIIVSTGCKPYLSCDYMPDALAAEPKMRWYIGMLINPPKDYKKWSEMLYQIAKHCIERYGLEEVRLWYWDCWNEPDHHTYFVPSENFFKIYDYFAEGIKRADSKLKIGGPTYTYATKDSLRKFLNHCVSETNFATGKVGTPIDYLSWHTYGSPDELLTTDRELSSVLKEFPTLKNCEVHQNEWQYKFGPDTINVEWQYNSYAPAHLCKFIAGVIDDSELKLDRFVRFGAFTQWQGFQRSLSITYGNLGQKQFIIPMPILNGYILLAKMGTERIELSGSDYSKPVYGFATKTANGVQIILYNFKELETLCTGNNEEVELTVKGLPTAWTTMKRYSIDKKNSNAFTRGYPSQIGGTFNANWMYFTTTEQIIQAEQDAKLKIIEKTDKLTIKNGEAKFYISLPSNSISLLIIGEEALQPKTNTSAHVAEVLKEETAYKAAMARLITNDYQGCVDGLKKLWSDSFNALKAQVEGDLYCIWGQKALFSLLNIAAGGTNYENADSLRKRILSTSLSEVDRFILLSDRLKYLESVGKKEEAKDIATQLQVVRSKLEVLANWNNWSPDY